MPIINVAGCSGFRRGYQCWGEKSGVKLFSIGKPYDHLPKQVSPAVQGTGEGSEQFYLPAIHFAEEMCGGGLALMRVGFVPDKIVELGDDLREKLTTIPGTKSIRIGDAANKADVCRVKAQIVNPKGVYGVGFFAADSGFAQIAVFSYSRNPDWKGSYFVHLGFNNLVPVADPCGTSLIDAVMDDIRSGVWGPTNDLHIRTYYGGQISPEWYGVGEDMVARVHARYGHDVGLAPKTSSVICKPTQGPRAENLHSISLGALLGHELARSAPKHTDRWVDNDMVDGDVQRNDHECPAGLRDEDGNSVLWSAVREAGTPDGNPKACNFMFFTLPYQQKFEARRVY